MTKDELIAELVKTLEDAVSTLEVFSPHPSQTKLEQILWGDVSVGMYGAATDTLHHVREALALAKASTAGDGWMATSDERDQHFAEAIRRQIDAVKIEALRCGWKAESGEWYRAIGKLEDLFATLEFVDPDARKVDLSLQVAPPSQQETGE